ncbi:hypothetical protein SAMN05518672_11570 [Chitinophaga sp. CF118]|uniref:hypothetical protein n=1 Tax=Chitinophaga sp. CF118 TaxID=1884367 RepID=UPI0008E0C8A9|nr:hypothetical protein [Chitinophaga sp. CF118]SFF07280.1 hypothetical protein SAMN05518672_11570 [Chitinophaga sp. CF118]
MNTIVIYDSSHQDLELGIEIHRIMLQRGWKSSDNFSFAYVKHSSNGKVPTEAEIKEDVDVSTFQAEWDNVKYLYQIADSPIKFGVSPGK